MAFDPKDLIGKPTEAVGEVIDGATAPLGQQLPKSLAPLYDLASEEVKDVAGEYLTKAVGAEALKEAEMAVDFLSDPTAATPKLANRLLAGALPPPARLLLGNQPLDAIMDPGALLENPGELAQTLANHALNTALPSAARLVLGDRPLEALTGNPIAAVQQRIQGFVDQLQGQWAQLQNVLQSATDTSVLEPHKPIAVLALGSKIDAPSAAAAPLLAAIDDVSKDAKPANLVCLPCQGTQSGNEVQDELFDSFFSGDDDEIDVAANVKWPPGGGGTGAGGGGAPGWTNMGGAGRAGSIGGGGGATARPKNKESSKETPKKGVAAGVGWKVAKHKDMPRPRNGFESHHGVMSKWMKTHYPAYNAGKAPAVLMPKANHRETVGYFNRWRAKMEKDMGGAFSWGRVSEAQIRDLGKKMFEVSKTPPNLQAEYWRQFERMLSTLRR